MRRLPVFLCVILLAAALALPASAGRLAEAGSVDWRGGAAFLDEDTGELIALGTEVTLLTGVTDLDWDGEALWARTADAWYRVEEDGALTEAGYRPETDGYPSLQYGFIITATPEGDKAVYRLSDGAELLRCESYVDVQVCRDERTGQDYILSARGDILRADGSRVVPEGTLCNLVRDCTFSYVQNGYAFGYPADFDEEHPRAVAIDLAAGETAAAFDGMWCDYVSWGMIYPDGTAVLGAPEDPYTPARIVRYTSGEILLDASAEGGEIWPRHADEVYYVVQTEEAERVFVPDPNAVRPERAPTLEYLEDESGRGIGVRLLDAAGQPIGEGVWQEIIPWNLHDVDLLSSSAAYFSPDGGAEVVAPDGKHGILGADGEMILPAAYDRIEHYTGWGYLVHGDEGWAILGVDGTQRY